MKACRVKLSDSFRDYCEESSIHGFQFLTPSRQCGHRLIWIMLLATALTLAGYVVKSLLDNWYANPTVTSIATTEYSIQKFPFPSVTVCPNEFDQWAFIERLGNAIDTPDPDFLTEHWGVFEPYLKEATDRARQSAWNLDRNQAKNKILQFCEQADVTFYMASIGCMNLQLLYTIGIKKHYGLAIGIKERIIKSFNETDRISYGQEMIAQFETAYLVLKADIQKYKIDCPDCFYWETSEDRYYDLAVKAKTIGKVFDNEFKRIENVTDSKRKKRAEEGERKTMIIVWEFHQRMSLLATETLNEAGSVASSYLSTESPWEEGVTSQLRQRAEDFVESLFKLVISDTETPANMLKKVTILAITQEDRLPRAYNSKLITSCHSHGKPEVGKSGCYFGPFDQILTIMRETITHPHMLDLNMLYAINFSGDVTNMTIQYPEVVNVLQSIYPMKPLKNDIQQDFEAIRNGRPFLPFCQLANKWSEKGKWGSHYIEYDNSFQASDLLGIGFEGEVDFHKWSDIADNSLMLHQFCTLFRPTITDKGICYSFNSVDSRSLFNDFHYMDAYGEVFGLPDKAYPKDKFVATGLGVQNGIRLVLDAHTLTNRNKIMPKIDNTFRLSIQHPQDFPLPLLEGIQIVGGFKTSIVLSSQVMESADSIRVLSPERRDCMFTNEPHDLKLFKEYGMRSCLYECMYNGAVDNCQCVPWNYPQFGNWSNICDAEGNICFEKEMTNGTTLKSCNCLSNCKTIAYPYTVNIQKIDENDCNKTDITMTKIKGYIVDNYASFERRQGFWKYLRFLRKIQEKPGDKERYPSFICEERLLKDIAIVDIYYGTQFATKLNRDLAATFTDKLANIGGTLGLFCGMSILSIMEIILCLGKFWYRATIKRVYRPLSLSRVRRQKKL